MCCAHIAQLMTHTENLHMAVYLAVMLLKPLGILQSVTKSQRVHHISNRKTEIKNSTLKGLLLKNIFSIYVVIKTTVVLNDCDCVANGSKSLRSL